MKDVQNQKDLRNLTVDQVGVSQIRYPITVKDKNKGKQETVALIDMTVELLPEFKGTHMSRFLEILNSVRGEMTMGNIPTILQTMRKKLDSPKSLLFLKFPYFLEKKAPISQSCSLFPIDVLFSGYSEKSNGENFILGIKVPITTLCPCSKEISKYGAHNQRSFVSLYINSKIFVWIEDLVNLIEDSSSCEIYPLLKRPDEKFVTEKAYENPNFAEDIVRNIASKLIENSNINWFMVETSHLESIHTHNAFARIERFKNKTVVLESHLKVFKGF
jgi:GTP cyclohydrolase I